MDERERTRELLGAYVLGHLHGDELARVENALAEDEQLRREAEELRSVADMLPLIGEDEFAVDAIEADVPSDLADGVLDSLRSDPSPFDAVNTPMPHHREVARQPRDRDPSAEGAPTGSAGRRPGTRSSRLSRFAAPVASVALVAAIAVGVIIASGEPEPGLGVEEPIEFAIAAPDLQVDASLVPHTWGTEVFLEMTGLVDGEVYLVDLETSDGAVSAGTFLGDSELEVVCIMNGAALREDVTAVVISTQDGTVVMRSELDPVDYRSV